MLQSLNENIAGFWPLLICLVVWELVWKIIAMWKSARNNHVGWFICIGLLNTIGILSIVYILRQRKKNTTQPTVFLY
ncbi:MAG TPA: DUF5652 family protein [Chitinophagaceae bacterium]|nr:DUF5652 family protein [Chitinophagaceae bacterium]